MTQTKRQWFQWALALACAWSLGGTPSVALAQEVPQELVLRLSQQVLDTIRTDPKLKSGEIDNIMTLVDGIIMPHVNFRRMTALAVGPQWRQCTPQQQQRLQDEFKTLLVRTYAGALKQVSDQSIELRPSRAIAGANDVVVRTLIKGRGDPIQLDYRLEKGADSSAAWKIYDMNVLGVWLVDTYRPQFAQQINAAGVDGLINALTQRNKSNAEKR